MSTNSYDIHDRIFNFVVAAIKLLNKLPKNTTNIVMINQCTRSATSMGANEQEADGALTKKDFIHDYTIVRKEGKETVVWLKLISKTNPQISEEANELINEGAQIVAIVSTIIKKASLHTKERK